MSFTFTSQTADLPRPCEAATINNAALAQLTDVPAVTGPAVGLFAHRVNSDFEYLLVIATAAD
ncbi:hypothetical protein D3C83_190190 [compost metagenome]